MVIVNRNLPLMKKCNLVTNPMQRQLTCLLPSVCESRYVSCSVAQNPDPSQDEYAPYLLPGICYARSGVVVPPQKCHP